MPRKLTQNQIDVLLLLYKFRFVTSNLLTQKLKLKHRNSINSRLQILEDQEYIGRRYDKSYKLLNKPASYFMLPKGFAVLRGMDGISNNTLKNMYKDAQATDGFVERSLTSFGIYNKLENIFGQRFELFGEDEADKQHFPLGVPVPGFEVPDFDAAVTWLHANNFEILGGIGEGESGTRWAHFRGPDGNIYEFVYHPATIADEKSE
jgi:hypothetical protein